LAIHICKRVKLKKKKNKKLYAIKPRYVIDTNNKFNRVQRRKKDFPAEMRIVFLEDLELELDL
jgi:hypothetical protein